MTWVTLGGATTLTEVELVEHPGREVLLHDTCSTGDRDILGAGRLPRLLQRGLDPFGDERRMLL